MSSETGEAAIQKLQDEIKSCKSILKCSVCSDRPKEVSVLNACKLTPLRSSFSFLAICIRDLSSLTLWYPLNYYIIIIFVSMCVYSVTLMDVGVIYILTGCNREVLSSFLQSMHPKKPRDSPSEVSCMWKCIWSKWRSVCKDIEELQLNSVVVVSNLASMKPQPLCSSWFLS